MARSSRHLTAGILALAVIAGCNNPFDTRDPEHPGAGGVAILPATTPENVLANLDATIEGLSGLDYLAVYTDDFAFSPDPDDSLFYEQEFAGGWGIDREAEFAYNFLVAANFASSDGTPIEVNATFEYQPGQEYYEYRYQMFIPLKTPAGGVETLEVEGYAYLYFTSDTEGNWAVARWEDHRLAASSLSWGALKAGNI